MMRSHNNLSAAEVAESLHSVARSIANGRNANEGPEFISRRSEILHMLSTIERLISSVEIKPSQLSNLAPNQGNGIELLTVSEAAEILRASAATLARWRTQGCGPEYVKRNGRVLYAIRAVHDFADGNKRSRTRPEH